MSDLESKIKNTLSSANEDINRVYFKKELENGIKDTLSSAEKCIQVSKILRLNAEEITKELSKNFDQICEIDSIFKMIDIPEIGNMK